MIYKWYFWVIISATVGAFGFWLLYEKYILQLRPDDFRDLDITPKSKPTDITDNDTPPQYSIEDIVDKLPRHKSRRYGNRSLSKIKYFVVHHSSVDGQTAYDYARYHVNTRGWAGIGYHYVITKEGKIERTNRHETVSFHVANRNTECLGICVSGDFEQHKPTRAQRAALVWLLRRLNSELPNRTIKGHLDFQSTDCPGKFLYEDLPNIRKESVIA